MVRTRRSEKLKQKSTQENTTNNGLATGEEDFVWTTERKITLLNCMIKRKPAGLNKHINMQLIKTDLCQRLKMNVPVKEIWSFLNAHWDMDKADKIEHSTMNMKKQYFELPQTEEWKKLIKEQGDLIKSLNGETDAMKQTSQAAIRNVDLEKSLKTAKIVVKRLDLNSVEVLKLLKRK